jgi:hypothetical protein
MKKWSSVLVLVAGAIILGATVLRQPIALAAQIVSAEIIGPLDQQGNLKVHDQGTVVVRDPEIGHQPWHMFLGPNDQYTVPDGKRLVIEYANGIAQLVDTNAQPDWTLSVSEGSGGQGYHFLGHSLPGCTNCYVMSEHLRLYAPPGSVVSPGFVPIGSVLRLSGYLIDL